jgi:hypothetical protein
MKNQRLDRHFSAAREIAPVFLLKKGTVMLFSSWLRILRISSAPTCRQTQRQAPRRRGLRLTLEQLEDRLVPTNFTAATVPDLIADINAANQAGGSNTITLTAPKTSPYVLSSADNAMDGATGLPVIAANDNLTLVGNGDTIARSTAAGMPAFRLLDVAGAASLTLQNLTLQGGLAFGAGISAEGGAVYNQGTLDLNGVTVQNNIAQGSNGQDAAGGGVYSGGVLTLEGNTNLQNNQALGGYGSVGGNGLGGGLCAAGGTATLTGITLSSNTAQGGQGGYGGYSARGGPGGNGLGGGLYVGAATVVLRDDSVSGNSARGGSGGLSYIQTSVPVPPVYVWPPPQYVWTLYATGVPGAGYGGGIYSSGALTLEGSTNLQNNQALGSVDGSKGYGLGGGLYVAGGTAILTGATVSSNTAQGAAHKGYPGTYFGAGLGGGLYINTLATVSLDAFTLAHLKHNKASTGNKDIFGSYTLIP